MDRSTLPRELRPFMDEDGRLKRWPTRQKTQRMAIALLATHFESGRVYNERQVNELLLEWHSFGDWALLRRVLVDWGHLNRERDGSRYWLRPDAPVPPPGQAPTGPDSSPGLSASA